MPTFEIELDETQVKLLGSYAETLGLTVTECIKMSALWMIRIETMVVTDTRPDREDFEAGLTRVVSHLDQIVESIKAARE